MTIIYVLVRCEGQFDEYQEINIQAFREKPTAELAQKQAEDAQKSANEPYLEMNDELKALARSGRFSSRTGTEYNAYLLERAAIRKKHGDPVFVSASFHIQELELE